MKVNLIKTTVLLLILCGFLAVSDIFAGTLTVTKILDTADGVCDADCSLREAVSAANSGDVIVFSPFFNAPQTIVLSGGRRRRRRYFQSRRYEYLQFRYQQ